MKYQTDPLQSCVASKVNASPHLLMQLKMHFGFFFLGGGIMELYVCFWAVILVVYYKFGGVYFSRPFELSFFFLMKLVSSTGWDW